MPHRLVLVGPQPAMREKDFRDRAHSVSAGNCIHHKLREGWSY